MAKREIKTHSGHKLTFREAKFIEYLVAGKSEKEAFAMAGYQYSNAAKYIKGLMHKDYILDELDYRFQKAKDANIADASEIMLYYSDVMRGKIKDQFGLDAPLAERTKAANELAKRIIDFEKEKELKNNDSAISVTLNWAREESNSEE